MMAIAVRTHIMTYIKHQLRIPRVQDIEWNEREVMLD